VEAGLVGSLLDVVHRGDLLLDDLDLPICSPFGTCGTAASAPASTACPSTTRMTAYAMRGEGAAFDVRRSVRALMSLILVRPRSGSTWRSSRPSYRFNVAGARPTRFACQSFTTSAKLVVSDVTTGAPAE
jgi:hypothetical protein